MPSFGEQLRRERERRSISLDDISVSTKISTRLLRALEEDHFEQLPGGIFNKGFIRAYAKCVGLDEDQIVADYLVASGEDQPVPAPLPEAPPRREEFQAQHDEKAWSIPWGSLAIVLLIAAIGLAIWRNRERMAQDQSTPAPRSAPATQSTASTQGPAPTLAAVPGQAANGAVIASTSSVPEVFTIAIRAREDCWISLTSDGKSVFEGMLVAGGAKKISAQHRAVVKAGNVTAIDISFNGARVPTDGQPGQVKAFSFDESGLTTVTSSEAPAAN